MLDMNVMIACDENIISYMFCVMMKVE